MINFKKLTEKAKDVVEQRGGVESLKQDGEELRGVARGKGSLKDKAKAAAEAVKDPGARGSATQGEGESSGGRPQGGQGQDPPPAA